jgi:hypothetical protein
MNSYRGIWRVTQPLHYMEVFGQLQVQAALPPGSNCGEHLIQGWTSPKAVLEVLEKKKTYFP